VDHLQQLFGEYCDVLDVTLHHNSRTGKRWALIEVDEEEGIVDEAHEEKIIGDLDGFWWRGERLTVRRARFREERGHL
jgi:hypothetical protein